MIGIYKITSPTQKIYIGSTNNFKRRVSEYRYNNCKQQRRLYNSFNKYNFENHIIELIEECDINNLIIRERYWQEYYNCIGKNGLNCNYVKTTCSTKIVSESTRRLLSLASKGKNNPRFGVILSEETKIKISNSNKGKVQSFELNLKQSQRMQNNTLSKLSKKVIDINTNIIYNSIRKASISLNINYNTLKKYLSGELQNKSTLKYI